MRRAIILAVLAAVNATSSWASFSFQPGHYYSVDFYSNRAKFITQSNPSGTVVGSLNMHREVRGIAFGPDGLLYATTLPRSDGFEVLAIDAAGTVQATYPLNLPRYQDPPYINGNINYGKIAVDADHIYVAGAGQLIQFEVGNFDSSRVIFESRRVYDVEIIPDGGLLVAVEDDILELSPTGYVRRSIKPNHRAAYQGVVGVEFNPVNDTVYVTQQSYTGKTLLSLDWKYENLENSTYFAYAADMFVTATGNLLVGSRSQTPRLYDENLEYLGEVALSGHLFVAQYPVPGPANCCLVCIGTLLLTRKSRNLNN